jgi:hypothetical protein
MWLLERSALVIAWLYLGHILFDHEFTLLSVASPVFGLIVWDFIKPLGHVIICNYRKVPYNGEEGSARRSSSGPRSS